MWNNPLVKKVKKINKFQMDNDLRGSLLQGEIASLTKAIYLKIKRTYQL